MYSHFFKPSGVKRLSELFTTEVVSSQEYEKKSEKGVVVTVKIIPHWSILDDDEKKAIESFRFVGKAVCSPEDEYDPVKGHDLANHRAMVKAYKYMQTLIHDAMEIEQFFANRFYTQINNKINKQIGFIEELSK